MDLHCPDSYVHGSFINTCIGMGSLYLVIFCDLKNKLIYFFFCDLKHGNGSRNLLTRGAKFTLPPRILEARRSLARLIFPLNTDFMSVFPMLFGLDQFQDYALGNSTWCTKTHFASWAGMNFSWKCLSFWWFQVRSSNWLNIIIARGNVF